MNIDEAIETLENDLADKIMPHKRGVREAEQLGIEALKRCRLARKEPSFIGPGLLPSETKN